MYHHASWLWTNWFWVSASLLLLEIFTPPLFFLFFFFPGFLRSQWKLLKVALCLEWLLRLTWLSNVSAHRVILVCLVRYSSKLPVKVFMLFVFHWLVRCDKQLENICIILSWQWFTTSMEKNKTQEAFMFNNNKFYKLLILVSKLQINIGNNE